MFFCMNFREKGGCQGPLGPLYAAAPVGCSHSSHVNCVVAPLTMDHCLMVLALPKVFKVLLELMTDKAADKPFPYGRKAQSMICNQPKTDYFN